MAESENLQYYHNKGEQDAADEKYDPPHNPIGPFSSLFHSHRDVEEVVAYNQGYENTKNQKK